MKVKKKINTGERSERKRAKKKKKKKTIWVKVVLMLLTARQRRRSTATSPADQTTEDDTENGTEAQEMKTLRKNSVIYDDGSKPQPLHRAAMRVGLLDMQYEETLLYQRANPALYCEPELENACPTDNMYSAPEDTESDLYEASYHYPSHAGQRAEAVYAQPPNAGDQLYDDRVYDGQVFGDQVYDMGTIGVDDDEDDYDLGDVDLNVIYDIGTADDGNKPRRERNPRYFNNAPPASSRLGWKLTCVCVFFYFRAAMLCTMT
jgi:hypothetical protein